MAVNDPNAKEQLLQQATNRGVTAELWHFVTTSRKWWLLPVLTLILLFGLVVVLGNTAVAPLIYTLF